MTSVVPKWFAIERWIRGCTSDLPELNDAVACFIASTASFIGKARRTSAALSINMLLVLGGGTDILTTSLCRDLARKEVPGQHEHHTYSRLSRGVAAARR